MKEVNFKHSISESINFVKSSIGKELKLKVKNKQSQIEIGIWAYEVYLEYPDVKDSIFLRSLMSLAAMELGPEFYFSYEELDKIAEDLILGKNIDLNPD